MDFSNIFSKLIESHVLVFMLIGLIASLIITPALGKLAPFVNAMDLPNFERRKNSRNLEQRIHQKALPRLGGLSIGIVFLFFLIYTQGFTMFSISVGLGIVVLMITGIIDDVWDLSGSSQLVLQVLAVLFLIIGGVRIESIQVLGYFIDFQWMAIPFQGVPFEIILPADIITILWFVVIINAMNWVSGIDALEETMAIISGLTLMLIALKFNNQEMLVLSGVFTSATIGFWFYNYPPAHILAGTAGNTIIGYLIALFAIKIDGKLTTSVLLLAIPIIDFLWVLSARMLRHKTVNPLKLLSVSGKHHLHHRLMALGFSVKQTLALETTLFVIFAMLAYYLAGFNIFAIAFISSVATIVLIFVIINLYSTIASRKKGETIQVKGEVKKEPQDPQKSPESVYAY